MNKLTTHLWFDTQAVEAAKFYTSLFKDSKIKSTAVLEGTPSGSVDVVNFDLSGHSFCAISAGPIFKFNPSISLMVYCETKEEVDRLWKELSSGGKTLMELGSYPFSEHYGWIQDRYGLSWQIMHAGNIKIKQPITPVFMFAGDIYGKAEEAINFYAGIFRDAHVDNILYYGADEAPAKEKTVKFASFVLEKQMFAAMDAPGTHDFTFNEAISIMVNCDTQEEIDYYWGKLSAVPESEQCGWLKDKYGVSWQIVSSEMDRMMTSGDKAAMTRVTEAFLKMKKFDLAELRRAFEGK